MCYVSTTFATFISGMVVENISSEKINGFIKYTISSILTVNLFCMMLHVYINAISKIVGLLHKTEGPFRVPF